MKFTNQARLARVEFMTYVNTLGIAAAWGAPIVKYLWMALIS